jgi:hypothetical protein
MLSILVAAIAHFRREYRRHRVLFFRAFWALFLLFFSRHPWSNRHRC